MTETVIFEREGPIGRLRLNRPAKLNAQTPQMWAELRELGRTLRDDRDLPRLVAPARAKELVFTAARIDAEEALRIGLVNRVVEDAELEAAVGTLAETIAAQPPLALRHAKRAIDAFADQERSLQLAAEGQAACLRSEDFVEAGKAFREGRAPVYRGR